MTETTVEKEICKSCGVEIRPQTEYCYNCGSAVSDSATASETAHGDAIETETTVEKTETIKTAAIEKTATAEAEKNQTIDESAKLKSAATLRRQPKTRERKTVEVVWEEHDNAPNVLFILGAFLLALLAGAILFLAMYLK